MNKILIQYVNNSKKTKRLPYQSALIKDIDFSKLKAYIQI
mgnify:CR=1 FL=1